MAASPEEVSSLASLRDYGDPRRQPGGAHRRSITGHVSERDPDSRRFRGEARCVGPSAALVRAWLSPYAAALDVEFYPKQDRLGPDGAGSLIRLPLGVHQRSRGWYPFVEVGSAGTLLPVGETVAACCAWLCQSVQRVAVPAAVQVECAALSLPPVRDRPLMASHVALSHLGRDSIRAWCRAQDLVAVIGRYVALDRRGVGSCPFKEHHYRGDQRPSFQVFHDHWYCYTWGRAGDLCDFLCLYYQLSPQKVWHRIQAGWHA